MAVLTDAVGYGTIGSRPAAGSPGRIYFSTEPATYRDNGSSWDDVSDSGGGGGGTGAVLGAVSYSSGSDTSWASTNSATPSDIDATNAKIDITVPASGAIVVMVECTFYTSVAGGLGSIGVRTGSTTLGMRPLHQYSGWNSGPAPMAGNQEGYATLFFYFTGLTPGAMTLKGAFAASGSGGSTLNIMAYDGASGHNGPFVMVAWAA